MQFDKQFRSSSLFVNILSISVADVEAIPVGQEEETHCNTSCQHINLSDHVIQNSADQYCSLPLSTQSFYLYAVLLKQLQFVH